MSVAGGISMYAYRQNSPIVQAGLRYQAKLARRAEEAVSAKRKAAEAARAKRDAAIEAARQRLLAERLAAHEARVRRRREAALAKLDLLFEYMPRPAEPSLAEIACQVSEKHHVSLIDLRAHRRSRRVVAARHEAMWRCIRETTKSSAQIAKFFGDRDHTTVLHAVKAHERRIAASGENEWKKTGPLALVCAVGK